MNKAYSVLGILGVLLAVTLAILADPVYAGNVNWNTQVIRGEGTGVAPSNVTSATQAGMLARRAAIADAYRHLAEMIRGVQVDAETTVDNLMVSNDEIRINVSAFIQGARIAAEHEGRDGSYNVTLEAPVFGVNSLASSVLPRNYTKEPIPTPYSLERELEKGGDRPFAPSNNTTPAEKLPARPDPSRSSAAPAGNGRAIGTYTGLIIDCRGLGLKVVMSPVVKSEGGSSIYGYKNLDYDKVIEKGMAGYALDLASATRAGSNPLIVKAIAVDKGVNPVLSLADAQRVLIENGATGFLDATNVVFIR